MASVLEFPRLVWKEGRAGFGVEVCIDFLPDEFRGRWLREVEEATYR